MREIKFRAWDGKNMRYPKNANSDYLIHFGGFCMQITEGMAVDGCPPIINRRDSWIVMQYTGLLDKNGKEIYEGDIAKSNYGKLYQIKWGDEGYWMADPLNATGDWFFLFDFTWEIIGNIYENPELLEPQPPTK